MITTSMIIDQNHGLPPPAHDVSRRNRTEPGTSSEIIVHPGDEPGFNVYDRSGTITTKPEKMPDEEGSSSETDEPGKEDLSESEKKEIQKLEKTDQEVRAHENAHMAAGAGLVRGSASYEYQKGPDGKLYAVGGEVSIDTSEEQDPEDTIRKMQRVQAAALAPADPSPQDRRVAMQAAMKAAMAQVEVAQLRSIEEVQESPDENSNDPQKNTGVHNYLKTAQEHAVGTIISTRT